MMANKYTKEQVEYLKSIVAGRSSQELVDAFNQKYELNLTLAQMSSLKSRLKLKNGVDTRFKKGDIPATKGTKGMFNVGGNRTSFKKGHRPKNYKPVGTERVDSCGYTLIKVQDKGPWHKRWRHKHRVLWENHNGPIPPGHKLIFLNKDKSDIRIENLSIVTCGEVAVINKKKLQYNDPQMTEIGIKIAKIAIARTQKENKYKK